jgi:hypothetical protein
MFWQKMMGYANARINRVNTFLVKLMLENTPLENGHEPFAQFMWDVYLNYANCFDEKRTCDHDQLLRFYVYLRFGDRKKPPGIDPWIAYKYYPQDLEKAYLNYYSQARKKFNPTDPVPDEKRRQENLKHYREQGKNIRVENGRAVIPGLDWHHHMDGLQKGRAHVLPELPSRNISEDERQRILEWCLVDLREEDRRSDINLLAIFDHLEEFCYLLRRPENHIKIASGQYVEKPVHVRQVHDMTDEMAQELSNLPRFNAYAKIIEEKNGEQTVWKGKMQTLPPLPGASRYTESDIQKISYTFCLERTEIEAEIRERQDKWRKAQTAKTSKPTSTSKPPPTSD